MSTMIKYLSKDVQGKLRSGVAIPSLQQCLEELILNSIDGEATCVGVRMDMEAFKVQVIDNGTGMSAEDMECVGNRYYTSKCSSVEDLDNLRWYGFRGEALASIVSLATLVEISSRTRSSVKTHVKIFKDGKCMNVFEAEAARPSAGTTVVICNFLHNMPVRRKRMDAVLEGERIRHRVEAISLMHPSVSFTLKNDCTGAMMVQLPKARNTYHRFVQIHSLGRAQKLGEISYTHGQFEVVGYIGKEGHYNNSLQFLYVNERLLLKTRIHKLLNFLLRRLSSSNQKNDSPDGQSAIRSPKHKRSQELQGVYIINIKCPYSEYDICLEPAKTLIEFKDWDGILLCIEEAVKAFLSRENLVSVLSRDDLDYAQPEWFGIHNTDQEGHNTGNGGQVTSIAPTLDCSIGMTLASHPVHRKRKDDCLCEESVNQESGQMECKEEGEQGEKTITANELENIKSDESINKEFRDEPTSDNMAEEEEPEFSEVGEGSQICVSSLVGQLESEKLSKEKEIPLNSTTSTSNVTSPDSITQQIQSDFNSVEQTLPDCQGTGGHDHTLVSNKKISLPDPFIHENLLSQGPPQINKSVFQQQLFAQKCEKKSFASKHKISLDVGQDRTYQTQYKDVTPVIPSKIPRIASCQKLSLCKEPGSLEKFRRAYGKSDGLKLPSQETHQENNFRLPQTDDFVLNPRNLLVCQKDQQDGSVTEMETEKAQSSLRSPPMLSVFTKLKPVSGQHRSKKSLAAKLCQLKQHKADNSKVLSSLSRTTSQDNTCLSGGNDGTQDSNNNENHGDTAVNPEPVPYCSTNPLLAEREEATTSGDWLHHYDASVGKTVYVNKVTGLSRYEDPPTEETQVHCTSDVTNMAVSVISEMDANCESPTSLTSLYSKWNNPVFVRPPTVGVDISSGQADGLAVKIHNILFPYRFSKAMIHSMKVIHQVDKKFLACLINTRNEEPAAHDETEGNLLVLVDQHAAHERVRLENLVADSYEDDPDAPGERRLCSSTILPPLEISVTEEELRLLRSCQAHLRSLGLEVKFSQAAEPQVFVGKVPLCFMEKESNEVRRGRASVIKPIVEEYLREQIELLRSTGRVRGTLPLTVLKVLASLACHGAIKFNDSLSRDECHSLVASLSSCQLPFQCAHGRPSIAPLVDTLHLDMDEKELERPNLRKLRRMHKAWELYGNRQELCQDMSVEDTPFVPTVTAISSTPDFQWMVQPTIITSVSPSLGSKQANEPQSSHQATPKVGGSKGKNAVRKGKTEQLSPEEEEKKRVRRERNKMAAAKCRNRRRELTDTLQTETDKLEEEKAALETEIANLIKEKERLEFILATHKPVCQMTEELESIFQEPTGSPGLPPSPDEDRLPEDGTQEAPSLQDMDIPSDPSTAISGNSNILLCASAEINICDLEPSLDIKEGLLENMLPSLEEKTPLETARSVPDIDLSSSLGVSDWETLYKSVSSDLEPLSTPVVTSTPTCSSYLSVFTFACPELDSLTEELDSHKGGGGKAESVDILNSPTLLALQCTEGSDLCDLSVSLSVCRSFDFETI